jgi:hypothetical protein
MATCPVVWRNQYALTHRTVHKSPRAMLTDLESIEKVFAEKYNEKPKANKAKASTATKPGEVHVLRIRTNGGGSDRAAPKKGQTAANVARLMEGPSLRTTPSSVASFDKDGKQKDMPDKPFDSAKKPWKKGSQDSVQVAYLTKEMDCPKPSDQPRDAARREECSDLEEKSLTTFCR